METILEDTRIQVDAHIDGMSVAELIGWKGDSGGSEPAWTETSIIFFHICWLVNKYLLSL